jgi:hypothetical protein
MAKAQLLSRNVKFKGKLPRFDPSVLLGEIEPSQLIPTDSMCKSLLALLPVYGLKRRDPRLYSSPTFLQVKGSVGMHRDSEFGNVLSWLVKKQAIGRHYAEYESIQLITKSADPLELRVGDVFIFNADYDHAWISNYNCMLLQVAVSGRVKPKNVKPWAAH